MTNRSSFKRGFFNWQADLRMRWLCEVEEEDCGEASKSLPRARVTNGHVWYDDVSHYFKPQVVVSSFSFGILQLFVINS